MAPNGDSSGSGGGSSFSSSKPAAAAAPQAAASSSGCFPFQNSSVPHSSPWGRMVDSIASRLAFFPPTPPSYTVEQHRDGTGELYIQPVDRNYQRVTSARVLWCPTSQQGGGSSSSSSNNSNSNNGTSNGIITAFIPFQDGRGKRAPLTLLYSHGNAVDLGQMLPVYRDLGRLLRCNVCGWDYRGYGVCSGQPSIAATCCDIQAVLEFLEAQHRVPRSSVVAYGQSVGSGPTVWLAAQQPGIAGVVLHSPLLSGVRVFNPNLRWWPSWADIFPNHLLVKKIDVPLLVLHGTADEVIDVSAGIRLAQLAPAAVEPLLADGYDHQNVEACPDYIPTLRQFLTHVQAVAQGTAATGGGSAAAAAGGGGSTAAPVRR